MALTQAVDTNNKKLATTAYVDAAGIISGGTWTTLTAFTTNGTDTNGETTAIPAGCTKIRLMMDDIGFTAGGDNGLSVMVSNTSDYTTTVAEGSSQLMNDRQERNWPVGYRAECCIPRASAARVNGIIQLEKINTTEHKWILTCISTDNDQAQCQVGSGMITVAGEMDRLKLSGVGTSNYITGSTYVEVYVP